MKVTQELFDRAIGEGYVRYVADCDKICEIVKDRLNITMSRAQAQTIWEWHSESYAAGWLCLYEFEDDIVRVIEGFVRYHLNLNASEQTEGC